MPKISMVIPTYSINDFLVEEAINAASSYRKQVDELIITEDGGIYSEDLRRVADIYIYNRKNVGFSKNVNKGWKLATGDFVMIANSDTVLHNSDLNLLCEKGMVTSPHIAGLPVSDKLRGCFWCAPKEVTTERGMLLEDMRTYFSDDEYYERIKDIFSKIDKVIIIHDEEQTTKATGINSGPELRKDLEIYNNLKKEGIAK
jgi:hypothetical protein